MKAEKTLKFIKFRSNHGKQEVAYSADNKKMHLSWFQQG